MSKRLPTVPARLMRGRADGCVVRVPVWATGPHEVYVALLDGAARLAPDPLDEDAVDVLQRVNRRWETYAPIANLGRDDRGRVGYWVIRALDPAERTAAAELLARVEQALAAPDREPDSWAVMAEVLAGAGYELPVLD